MQRALLLAGSFLTLTLMSGCVSVDLPDHKICKTDKAGQEDKQLPEMTGTLESVSAGKFKEPMKFGVMADDRYRNRKKCLDDKKVPVVVMIRGTEWESCVAKDQAPQGCR